jgi:hypothetical protein
MPINYNAILLTALISLSTFGIVSFSFPPNPLAPHSSSIPPTTALPPPTTTSPPTTTPVPCTVANYSLTVGLTPRSYDFYTAGFDQPRNLFVVAYNGNRVKLITPENVTIWDKSTPCEGYFRIFMDGSSFYVSGQCTNNTNYIAKYDSAGDVQWLQQISYGFTRYPSIIVNASVIIVLQGSINPYADFHDSLTGVFIRSITLTLDMSYNGDAGLFLSGGFLYVSYEGTKTRFDGNGNEEFLFFNNPDQPPYYFYGNSITIDANGYMYESGGDANSNKAYVEKFSLNGTRIWIKILLTEFGNVNSYETPQGFPNTVVISDIVYSVGTTIGGSTILSNTTLTTYNATNGNVILAIPDFLIGPNINNDHFSNFMLTDTNFYILTNRGRYGSGKPITISGYCPP